jgi:small multidrug resistance family-3 protein
MKAFLLLLITAIAEILGCYAAFLWLRHDKTALWAVVAAAGLGLFAWLLTIHPMANAGRVYAAYGGVYIVASLFWLWLVEGHPPDRWDLTGAELCLVGAAVIYFGPRG